MHPQLSKQNKPLEIFGKFPRIQHCYQVLVPQLYNFYAVNKQDDHVTIFF